MPGSGAWFSKTGNYLLEFRIQLANRLQAIRLFMAQCLAARFLAARLLAARLLAARLLAARFPTAHAAYHGLQGRMGFDQDAILHGQGEAIRVQQSLGMHKGHDGDILVAVA